MRIIGKVNSELQSTLFLSKKVLSCRLILLKSVTPSINTSESIRLPNNTFGQLALIKEASSMAKQVKHLDYFEQVLSNEYDFYCFQKSSPLYYQKIYYVDFKYS